VVDAHSSSGSQGALMRLFRLIWPDNVANTVAICIAVVASVLGLFDIIDLKKLLALTLASIALLAFSLIRDRISRDALAKALTSLLESSRAIPADRFFTRQTPERSVLQSAYHAAYLIQETGSLITEQCQDEIIRILKADGTIKVVVCLPNLPSTRTLAYRNENLDIATAISNRLDSFHNQLKSIKRSVGASMRCLQVRYTPYDTGFTLVLSNPAAPFAEQKGLVRLAGFRIPYSRKLDFVFDNSHSPMIAAHFTAEFDELFESSTKFVILAGDPRVGKTRMFRELLAGASHDPLVYFVVSVAEYQNGSRASFFAQSSIDPDRRIEFAKKNLGSGFPERDVRQYELQTDVWDAFAAEIHKARTLKQIIVIDEIGEMQLQSAKFCEVIRELLADPEVIVFATCAADESRHPLLREVNQHHRTTVLKMTTDNYANIARSLRSEFEKSLRLQEYLNGK